MFTSLLLPPSGEPAVRSALSVDEPPSRPPARRRRIRLAGIPSPIRLFVAVCGSPHYHLGYFLSPDESMATAQDRLIERGTRCLDSGLRILDVGCGLGGAAAMLSGRGHSVVGIDPNPAAIDHARAFAGGRCRFEEAALAPFARSAAGGPRFDAILAVEVMHVFPAPEDLLGPCRSLLRPRGTLIVCDVVSRVAPCWTPTLPYHPPGSLAAAARKAGYVPVEIETASERVFPSFRFVLGRLERWRAAAERNALVAVEVAALEAQYRSATAAWRSGEVGYEITVLRRRA